MPKLKFTLDRNILIAAKKRESDVDFILKLFDLHSNGNISIAISLANCVENQKDRKNNQSIKDLENMCTEVGLYPVPEFLSYPLDWDMGSWESSIISQEGFDLELDIHKILFPNIVSYRSKEQLKPLQRKVTNAKCDVFAIWGHIYFKRDCFVSNDRNFHKKSKQLVNIGAKLIATPQQAIEYINNEYA